MRKYVLCVLLVGLLALSLASVVQADKVISQVSQALDDAGKHQIVTTTVENGTVVEADRSARASLTGNGVLTVKPRLGKKIYLDMATVTHLETIEPRDVTMKDGTVLKGKITTRVEGVVEQDRTMDPYRYTTPLTLTITGATVTDNVPWDEVVGINLKSTTSTFELAGNAWSGNTDQQNLLLGLSTKQQASDHSLSMSYSFKYAEEKSKATQRDHNGNVKFERDLRPVGSGWTYWSLNLDAERDLFQDYDLYTSIGPGYGWRKGSCSPERENYFSVEAGFSWVNTNRLVGDDESALTERIGVSWQDDALFDLFGAGLGVDDEASIYPGWVGSSRLKLRNKLGLDWPVNDCWDVTLQYQIDYDKNKIDPFHRTDNFWSLGMKYTN